MSFEAKSFLKAVSSRPGVYRMFSEAGELLYVGKAGNLKKRLESYFRQRVYSLKTARLVQQIATIETTLTASENEALILEHNLIKQHRPRYNVLLRDDKSYPYLLLTAETDFPRLMLVRGAKNRKGRYFGPYPNSSAARQSLHLLQKLFRLRQCEDSYFKNRTRPCLQYQIHRCSAPCVGFIDKEAYEQDLRHAVLFLEGKNGLIIDELVLKMEQAATERHFEQAALYRDQISQLRQVQEQYFTADLKDDVDIIGIATAAGLVCIQVLSIRHSQWLGNRTYFPEAPEGIDMSELLAEFLPQYYLNVLQHLGIPDRIVVSDDFPERVPLSLLLTQQRGRSVKIVTRIVSGARWQGLALENAQQALRQRLANRIHIEERLKALQTVLGLDFLPRRLECFDISHTQGEATVASCVVFNEQGPLKSDYRRFNIDNITPGDDYAAMAQALTRRYGRLKSGEGKCPDLLIIDGGKGQLTQAHAVLESLAITGIIVLGIAKGLGRKPGLEVIYGQSLCEGLHLPPDSSALHLLQQIRDEAHRFAITAHRQRRQKARRVSVLEGIPGIGPLRRRELLRQFGGIQELKSAGVDELAKVRGISPALAQKIFDILHNEAS